jgi:predicted O-methyltransferase YrrM
MKASLATRVGLKIRRIARELAESPAEREFRRFWPLVDSIEGWLYPSEGRWLFNTARSLPNHAKIVEVGSYKGRSTCCLALACRGTQKRVFAIDTFDGGPDLPKAELLPDFSNNLARSGLSAHVEPTIGLSGLVASTWDKPINFLFVDGSHQYADVVADFAGFFPHVVPGGIVAFHDVNESWPGVLRAWTETIKPQLTEIGYCDTLGYGRKPSLT